MNRTQDISNRYQHIYEAATGEGEVKAENAICDIIEHLEREIVKANRKLDFAAKIIQKNMDDVAFENEKKRQFIRG